MGFYKSLEKQNYRSGNYSLVPIRSEDRYDIMKWRNEQMYHLRQSEPLTKEKQDSYFDKVVAGLFEKEKPDQILFSYLEGGKCIGYGGLVHINWVDKNAEISFIMETALEKNHFELHWEKLLFLIEEVAFNEIRLHKIYTYAFDIRDHLYPVLEKCGYKLEAELKEHCYFGNNFLSVKIHSKIDRKIEIRKAKVSDFQITLDWANDSKVRAFSYNRSKISPQDHKEWFFSRIVSQECEYYILLCNGKEAGSIRFDLDNPKKAKINYLIDPIFTGKGLGTLILQDGLKYLQKNLPSVQVVYGYVLEDNIASKKIFEKLSFMKISENNKEIKYEKKLK